MNNPFSDIDTEDNNRIEQLNKRQRELERRIRKTKQGLAGTRTAIEAINDNELKFEIQQMYDQKAALLRKQNNDYNTFCKENNLKKLSERLSIAKWNREESIEANKAAARYNNARKE